MQKLLQIFLILTIAGGLNAGQKDDIKLQIHFSSEVNRPLSLKIAYYYGSRVFLQDSINVQSLGKKAYSGAFHSGIYLLVFPNSEVFEFLVDERNELSIRIVQVGSDYMCSIRGDSVTKAYDSYQNSMSGIFNLTDTLKSKLRQANDSKMQNRIKQDLKVLKDSLQIIRTYYAKQYEGTLLGNYLKAQIPIPLPSAINETAIPDSSHWISKLYYFRDHYLDNIEWDDQRLIWTPVIEEKINDYFKKFVKNNTKSNSDAIDLILHKSNNEEINKFLIDLLFRRYEQNKHKAIEEYSYLYLVKNYYLQQKSPRINKEQTAILEKEINKLWPTSLGQTAPQIILPNKDNELVNLHETDSRFTLVFFWSYECQHCMRILQDLVSVVSKYKYLDLTVLSVFTGEDPDIWRAYLEKKVPQWWLNTYQPDKESKVTDTYNISAIPSIYLLDSEKTIVNKNVTVSELDTYFFQTARKEASSSN